MTADRPGILIRTGRSALPLLVGLAGLTVYLLTLAPSITWRHQGADSAELAVAAAALGVPHPPGYPTWTLLAWLWSHLPCGELAQRVALLSACSAAAAAAVVTWLVQSLWPNQVGSRAAAAAAGLTLAFGFTFWSQAILVEVYALHTLFVALLIALTLPAASDQPQRRRLAAFVFGLGLGNHLSLIFCGPLLLWRAHWRWCAIQARFQLPAGIASTPVDARRRAHWRWCAIQARFQLPVDAAAAGRVLPELFGLLLPILAGLAIYLYLPLAAGRDPTLLWGDPTTPGGFWWLVSAQLYRGALFGLTGPEMLVRGRDWLGLLAQPLAWPGLALAAWGLRRLTKQARRVALLTVGVALLFIFYALGYATADAFVYLLPVCVFAALWQAAGVLNLAERLARRRLGGWAWLVCLLPLALLLRNWASVDLSRDVAARQYALDALAAAAPHALLIASGDEHTFALWYAQDGLGQRPDVAIVERTLWNFDWYRQRLARRWPDLSPAAGPDVSVLIESQRARRPIFITDPDEDLALRYELEPIGLLFRVQEQP